MRSKKRIATNQTINTYLHNFKKEGIIFDAGKSWYSFIENHFTPYTEPIKPVIQDIKEKLPLLPFSCWSTQQLNSFTHHLLAKFIIFVYADQDYLPTTAEILETSGYNIYINPTRKEIDKFFKHKNKTLVLLPSISKEPKAIDSVAPIEKILVDFLMMNKKFHIMDESEAEETVEKAINSGRINYSLLLDYLKRRKINNTYNQLFPPK